MNITEKLSSAMNENNDSPGALKRLLQRFVMWHERMFSPDPEIPKWVNRAERRLRRSIQRRRSKHKPHNA